MSKIRSVCVYCGSRVGGRQAYGDVAASLGQGLAARGMRVVYGGGRVGLMGVLADAALAAGGEVVGVIPEHLFRVEVGHEQLSELHVVANMHERKHKMFELSDAFVVLPGGIGTLDETFEIVTWKQLKLHDRPILLLNQDRYWQPFLDLVDQIVGQDFAAPAIRDLFGVVDGLDGLFAALAEAPAPRRPAHPERL